MESARGNYTKRKMESIEKKGGGERKKKHNVIIVMGREGRAKATLLPCTGCKMEREDYLRHTYLD